MRESNPHQKFWRLLSYHLTNPLYIIKRGIFTQLNSPCSLRFVNRLALNSCCACSLHSLSCFQRTFKTTHKLLYIISSFLFLSPYGYALDRLVTVSCMHYCTSTSVLSTLSSSRGLTTFVGISHLEGGFTLRCLQRLSRPGLATLPCSW